MTSNGAAQVFRTDLRPLLRMSGAIGAWAAPALMIAAAIGQMRADRFPSYFDLFGAGLIGLGIAAALAAFLALCVVYFTITVSPEGLRGYNAFGFYRTFRWADIDRTDLATMNGIPYLLVFSRGSDDPMTVPLWLSDMQGFIRAVTVFGGSAHVIVRALDDAA